MLSTGSLLTVLKSKPNDIIVQELQKTLAERVSLGDTVSKGTLELFMSVISAACVTAQSLCCALVTDENAVDDSSDEDGSADTESLSDPEQTSDTEVRTEQVSMQTVLLKHWNNRQSLTHSIWLSPCCSCRMMHQSQAATHILASLYVMCCMSLLTTRLYQFSSACNCALLSRNSLRISKLSRQHSKCTY
jgi:hypothetical protein